MNTKNLLGFGLVAILAILTVSNPFTSTYVHQLKNEAVQTSSSENKLLKSIEAAAKKYDIPPQDAQIDRVWKAMPGYNGIQVDIEASYKKMKGRSFDERKLVFKQIPPKVHLDDLPPAPIYRGHPDKPMVALLINVAWGNEYLPSILQTLKKHNVQGTFFLEGRWVKENPDLAKMIAAGGHEIGNHSYSHPKMESLGTAQAREEIVKANEVIEATTGKKPVWFGPPSGGFREETIEIAHDLNMKTVLWTVDTIDWQKPSPGTILKRVMSRVHPGAMILMHPTDPTAQALEQLIIQIKSKHLRIGTVSKLMDEEYIIKIQTAQ
ncbi:polysaccharide deacetylase family protein [Siminovitchia sp. FSL H7-0308]|uniref:Sporulation protein (Polysaccharide deacetylase family) n=1 Tax=Siminovitchia thermophila TaxID=1245522 RepID=A0ABS2R9X2_9BACI|nr:polysaccharide deacetylase family protein [Siminovitchia thermophila]MBM7716436.1 putative sporulation protein (polysaccharide deacetylase family) [Siminovitchia thermophila]